MNPDSPIESLQSRLLKVVLRITGRKRRFASAASLLASLARSGPVRDSAPPLSLLARLSVTRHVVRGHAVFVLARRRNPGHRHVLYLHGGAFVDGILKPHWQFLDRLVEAANCSVTVPVYPLAPEYTHADVFALMRPVYRALVSVVPPDDLVLMGDSAGGGMALALAQSLVPEGLAQPGGIVLMSPWLDATLTDPAIERIVPIDPMLAVPGLREAARRYAGGSDLRDPMISPINGPLQGLAPITLFTGTHELLLPDARRLRESASAQGAPLSYHEYPGMVHAWPLLPVPEARRALQQIVRAVAGATAAAGGVRV
jgi:epsilon-lactone hydrolase